MNEASVRQKIFKDLCSRGYWPITQTDAAQCRHCGKMTHPPTGRPDILVLSPTGRSFVCEVKVLHAGNTSFAFSKISAKQRKWLNRWSDDGGTGLLALGVIRQHGQRQFLDYVYFVPWPMWLEVEETISDVQQSIPLRAGKGYRKELQENKWDIIHLLERWEGFDALTEAGKSK